METNKSEKEAIIAEYIRGGISFRKLGEKYGISKTIIHRWVDNEVAEKYENKQATALTKEVKKLREELNKSQLNNKLLNAIIDIAEQELKIPIRKKSGTKQS